MNENEIWKDIEGYEGLYQISSLGRVKSLGNDKTKKEKILKQDKNKNGYFKVNLWKNNKTKTCQVHRLVAHAFIENPNKLPIINHKDENPSNNMASNLEWCTQKYNVNYGTCKIKIADSLSKQVYQYSLDLKLIKIWQSTMECGRNGYNQKRVSDCCLSKRKTHKGFLWSYKPL